MTEATKHAWYRFKKINLFVNPEHRYDESDEEKRFQLISTHIYIVTLTLSLLILALYTYVIPRPVTITVAYPSIDVFQELERKNVSTLSCVCQQTSTSYSNFVMIMPKYHQVIFFSMSVCVRIVCGSYLIKTREEHKSSSNCDFKSSRREKTQSA